MNELDILLSDDFRRSVEDNLSRDPMRIALDRTIPHAAQVATQVKYLARAGHKLPSFHAARCILPPRAFEQSSSEATASRKDYSGSLAIDLTCGLGVDSLWLSKRFERVIAVERDAMLAAIARENFRRLEALNVEVVNRSAEEFLAEAEGRAVTSDLRADLVYADPDRRDAEGRKMVRIEDCSPDIASLTPLIRRIAPRLVVKLSPLFDVDEVFRIFGTHTRVEVVSVGGECKEIIADIELATQHHQQPQPPTVRAVAIDLGEVEYPVESDSREPKYHSIILPNEPKGEEDPIAQRFSPEEYRYLIIPDVALQKARLARRYITERGDIYIESDNGYGFSAAQPGDIMGKTLEIESVEPFDPKELKRRLRAQNIKRIDILKREFPLSATELARSLGIREGGKTTIAFTRADGKLWQITVKV